MTRITNSSSTSSIEAPWHSQFQHDWPKTDPRLNCSMPFGARSHARLATSAFNVECRKLDHAQRGGSPISSLLRRNGSVADRSDLICTTVLFTNQKHQ